MTLAKTMLERAGAGAMSVTELPIGQHVGAIAAGQIDGVYTLEPTGTVGRLNGTTRVLEAGVVAHYILGDPQAPWHGGSASLTTEFIKKYPAESKKFIAAYAKGIELVRNQPAEARQFMKGYTAIDGPLTAEVPLASYMLYNEFKASDVAYFQKFYDLFSDKGIFEKRVMVEPMLFKGVTMADATSSGVAAPWTPPAADVARPQPKSFPWARLLPVVGPLLLFIAWDLVVRLGFIKPILLPTPWATLGALFTGLAGGPLLTDFAVTVLRTLEAFLIAAVIGVPLGVLLGSNEKAYRSVEFLIDFFRSTPSSALIPLFLLIFGVSDINKVAIAAFGALLIVVFNSAYGVINARKQRVMAARVMGATRGQVFKDVLIWESLQPTFVGLRSAGVDGARDRHRRRDVHRLRQRPRPSHHRRAAGAQREEHVRGDPRRRRARLRAQRAVPRRRTQDRSLEWEVSPHASRLRRSLPPEGARASSGRPVGDSR